VLQWEQQHSSSHFHSPALPRLPNPGPYSAAAAAVAVDASPSAAVYPSEPHALSLGAVVEEEEGEPGESGYNAHNAFGLNGDGYVATFLASKWEILGVILRSRSLGSLVGFSFPRCQGEALAKMTPRRSVTVSVTSGV